MWLWQELACFWLHFQGDFSRVFIFRFNWWTLKRQKFKWEQEWFARRSVLELNCLQRDSRSCHTLWLWPFQAASAKSDCCGIWQTLASRLHERGQNRRSGLKQFLSVLWVRPCKIHWGLKFVLQKVAGPCGDVTSNWPMWVERLFRGVIVGWWFESWVPLRKGQDWGQFKGFFSRHLMWQWGWHCLARCPSGFIESGANCVTCNPKCGACSITATNCTSCPSGTFFYQFDCLGNCPTGMFNGANGVCTLCESPCKTCTTRLNCLTCANNFYMFNGTSCVAQCPNGFI